jgi:TrmH family RNA methyltransferase
LLTPDQRDRLDVVLVSPRNPLNIGAAARAMANFGFRNLTVVAPYEPHWREARSAVGAPDILKDARETATLAEAVAACMFILGTGTHAHREPTQPVLLLPDATAILAARLGAKGRVALVFGTEKHGLTRDNLSYCHTLVEIPTDPLQPSMNLGQAVAVCLYELSSRTRFEPANAGALALPPVSRKETERPGHGNDALETASASGDLDRLAALIEGTMVAAGYSPRGMQAANRHDLRVMLRRLDPSRLDTRRMMGLFRRILYRLNHAGSPPP